MWKKKICNKAKQQTASPTDYRGSKPMDSQQKKKTPIQSKSLNQKRQISKLEITKAKANLKTEQRLPLEVRSV